MSLNVAAQRIERLRPSDVQQLKRGVAEGQTSAVVEAFLSYLKGFKEPSPADLDDIARVSAQIRKTGLWTRRDPVQVLASVPGLDETVLSTLEETLSVSIPRSRKQPLQAQKSPRNKKGIGKLTDKNAGAGLGNRYGRFKELKAPGAWVFLPASAKGRGKQRLVYVLNEAGEKPSYPSLPRGIRARVSNPHQHAPAKKR